MPPRRGLRVKSLAEVTILQAGSVSEFRVNIPGLQDYARSAVCFGYVELVADIPTTGSLLIRMCFLSARHSFFTSTTATTSTVA